MKSRSNHIYIAYENRTSYPKYNYKSLKEKNRGRIENFFDEFITALEEIKFYCIGLRLDYNLKAGYYLYPLLKDLKNLSELKIRCCDIPYSAFAKIEKTLPNLNNLELESVNLAKLPADNISELDIVFPQKLTYLKIFKVQVIASALLSDHYEYLFSRKGYPIYEYFTLPEISIPTLKRLDFIPKDRKDRGFKEFLEVNPSIESMYIRSCELNINSSLKSLKSLDSGGLITFNDIDQAFRTSFINILKLESVFCYCESFIKVMPALSKSS